MIVKYPDINAWAIASGWTVADAVIPERVYTCDQGNYLRIFKPVVAETKRGIKLEGQIGLLLPEFERQWQTNHPEYQFHLPFGMLTANCPALVYSPFFDKDDCEGMQARLIMMLAEVEKLPRSISEAADHLRQGRIGAHPTRFYFMPNEKSEAAIAWILNHTLAQN